MLTKDDVPVAWRGCLKELQQFWPEAVLAGGALRDRDNKVKPKDLDFFLPSHSGLVEDVAGVFNTLKQAGWDAKRADAHNYARPGLIGVVDVKYPGCPPVQIVVGKWNTATIEQEFDFGICQIVFDGREIRRTHEYRSDQIRRTFTYLGLPDDISRSVDRFARIKPRYPNWLFKLNSQIYTGSMATLGYTATRRSAQYHPNIQQLPRT